MSLAKYNEDNWSLVEERLFMKGGMCGTLVLNETRGGIIQNGRCENFNANVKEKAVKL